MKENQKKKSKNNRLPVFYIALCCCVLAIGAAGYISDSLKADETATLSSDIVLYTPTPVYTAAPVETSFPSEVPVFNEEVPDIPVSVEIYEDEEVFEDYTFDNPDIMEVNAEAQMFEGIVIPLDGEILQPFCAEPYYNEVMGDWRTHNGIDIAAGEGSEVICAANGEVKEIISTVYGKQLTISHSDGFETVYSQFEPKPELTAGSNVRCGDVIGTVVAPKGEPVSEVHLHFEIIHEGKYINPADFISG